MSFLSKISSEEQPKVENSNWGIQIAKATVITVSSIVLGWVLTRIWRKDEEVKVDSLKEKEVAVYKHLESSTGTELIALKIVDSLTCSVPQSSINSKEDLAYRAVYPSYQLHTPLQIKTAEVPFFTISTALIALMAGQKKEYAPSTAAALIALFTLSQGGMVKADWLTDRVNAFKGMFFPDRQIDNLMKDAIERGEQAALVILEAAGKVINGTIEKVEGLEHKFMVDLGEQGTLLINTAGDRLELLTKNMVTGVQATLQIAGYEARFTVQTIGEETRKVIQTGGQEVRATIQEFGQVVKLLMEDATGHVNEVIANVETSLDHVILRFGQQGQIMIDKTGDKINVIIEKRLEQLIQGGNCLLSVAGKETRLTIETVGKEVRLTIGEGEKAVKNSLTLVKDLTQQLVIDTLRESQETFKRSLEESLNQVKKESGLMGKITSKGLVQGILEALWGVSELQKIENIIQDRVERSSDEERTPELLRLLVFVNSQGQLTITPSNRAHLYTSLIRYLNDAELEQEDIRWLSLLVAGVASQDEKLIEEKEGYLYSTKTNYFHTVVLPALPYENIRKAFIRNNFYEFAPVINKKLSAYLSLLQQVELPPGFSEVDNADREHCEGKSCEHLKQSQEIFDGSNPVGTIITYASHEIPHDHLICDGSLYSKLEYRELYAALGGRYGEVDDKFRVPDYRGRFLRGPLEGSKLGQSFEDTTRLPRQSFFTTKEGKHFHTMDAAGEHKHSTDTSGVHKHDLSKDGIHIHETLSEGMHEHNIHKSDKHTHHIHKGGVHTHAVHSNGEHEHKMEKTGKHIHPSAGGLLQLLKADGHFTAALTDDEAHGRAEPNLITSEPMTAQGEHVHDIHKNGKHIHEISDSVPHIHDLDLNGEHSHGMDKQGAHKHGVTKSDSHTHVVAPEGIHSHTTSIEKAHVHTLAAAGEHDHKIEGGDAETAPKNTIVQYLIKAKPSTTGKQIQKLLDQVHDLQYELENRPTLNHVSSGIVVATVLGILGLRFMRR